MYFHGQILKKRANIPLHARFWIGKLNVEWCFSFFKEALSFGYHKTYDRLWKIHFSIICLSFYANWESYSRRNERHFMLSFHRGALHFVPWGKPHEWNSGDPWWVRGVAIDFADLIFGKTNYSQKIIEKQDVLIPMPEGAYKATVEMFWGIWKRPRWIAKKILRANVEIPSGIPKNGKGENSWDCDEDATFGITMPAKNVENAIGKTVESCLKDRKKYGTPGRLKPKLAV